MARFFDGWDSPSAPNGFLFCHFLMLGKGHAVFWGVIVCRCKSPWQTGTKLGELMNQDNLRFQYQYTILILRIRSLTDFHMLVKCRINLRALLLQTLHAPSSTVVTVSQKVEQMLYGNSGLPRGLLGKEPATAVEYISTRGLYPPRLRLDWVMMDYTYESWNTVWRFFGWIV